jgi:hypothetical protein
MARVFVSHRLADADQARRLASAIRADGHEVWLDEWEVRPGDSLVQRIDEGLAGAEYLVLCYSGAGVDSAYTSREWMSALARQLDGADIKILPVRLTGGTPPAILADIRYADLVADWDGGVRQICLALA